MAKSKTKQPPELQNKGSLITYKDNGVDRCLGDLMHFKGRGVYDANFGRVDVTPEEAETHNRLLDNALIEGLANCEIGQWGTFYLSQDPLRIHTFNGTVVSERVTRRGRSVEFLFCDRTFQGIAHTQDDLFNFKRIA